MTEGRLLFGAPLSLTGRYAHQGRLAAAGLRRVLADARPVCPAPPGARTLVPELLILDDESTRRGVRRALDSLRRADVLFAPYGSDLVAEAAKWAGDRERALWNHSASADSVQRLPGVVSVPSPASRYFQPILEALAPSYPAARVVLVAGAGGFGRSIADGVHETASRLGMTMIGSVPTGNAPEVPDTDVLLAAGSFEQDIALLRGLRRRPIVIAAVAGGISMFSAELGERVEGILAPSQWEEGVRFRADVGPPAAQVAPALGAEISRARKGARARGIDYPAAQAYAAGLLAHRCVEETGSLEDRVIEATAHRLRCTTFFGRFGLGRDGRQRDHEVLAVQWQGGVKRVVWPPALADAELRLR